MAANHLDNIVINIILDPAPLARAGFGTVLLIADEAAGTTLDSDRIRTYASVAAAQTDATAGFISASILAAITDAFSQRVEPVEVKIGRKAAIEDYGEALAAIILVDPDFYAITIESRAAVDQVIISPIVEASSRILILQSADADWLTTGIPAAYTTIANSERTAIVFHDIATEWSDFAWAVNRSVFDPDLQSAPWDAGVQAVAAYTAAPTDTEKGFLDANFVNHGLPFGSDPFFVDAGVNLAGRQLHEIVTSDWFEARLQEDVATVKTTASARGDKIVIDSTGQAQILAVIAALFQVGVNADHFVTGQTAQAAETITQADLDAGRLRFNGQAQIAGSARIFVFNFNFSRTPIVA